MRRVCLDLHESSRAYIYHNEELLYPLKKLLEECDLDLLRRLGSLATS